MTSRLKQRKKNPTHEQMLDKGYSLEHPTKKQPKNYITALAWGNNGRQYWKTMKMTAIEKRIDIQYNNLKKAGQGIRILFLPVLPTYNHALYLEVFSMVQQMLLRIQKLIHVSYMDID